MSVQFIHPSDGPVHLECPSRPFLHRHICSQWYMHLNTIRGLFGTRFVIVCESYLCGKGIKGASTSALRKNMWTDFSCTDQKDRFRLTCFHALGFTHKSLRRLFSSTLVSCLIKCVMLTSIYMILFLCCFFQVQYHNGPLTSDSSSSPASSDQGEVGNNNECPVTVEQVGNQPPYRLS